MIGAIATIVTKSQPGSVLGLSVLAGTVAAALTVQPRTGRLIFPVPALSYLIAALGAGVVYDRSADKTQIAVGAAQWIASGFFVMVLATLLAIALTTVRWFMWRRDQAGPGPPDWPAPGPGGAPAGAGPGAPLGNTAGHPADAVAARTQGDRGPGPALPAVPRTGPRPGARTSVPGRGTDPAPTTSPAGRSAAPGA